MTTKRKEINPLDISFKEFMPGQIIQSGQFNDDMNDIEEKVNELIGDHNVVSKDLYTHLEVFDNPHRVDAHQTGTYFAEEIDEFIQDVKSGNLYDNSITNRVLDDDSVDNRNIIDGSITNSKLDNSIGSQIDISQNISITDRYTKEETDLLIQEKVGDGTYDKETIDEKLEQIQAGQILDKSISIHQLKDDVGRRLDISNNPDIINKYTRDEVDLLIQNNALPRDWGSILEEDDDTPVEIPTRETTLPVANHMKVGTFTVSESPILDIDIQENVDARGEYNTIGERLNNVDSQINDIKYKTINVLELGMNNEGLNSSKNTEILNYLSNNISGCKVFFPSGVYLIEDHWVIDQQKNFEIEFSQDAILKVKEKTKISHIFALSSCRNFKIINPCIDGNNIKGLNGLAFNGLSNTNYCGDGYIENLRVQNLFRKAVTDEYEWSGGGRAFTCQFAVKNIVVDSVNVKNCTTAVDFHGRFGDTDIPHSPVTNIIVNNVIAENCEEVVSGYSLVNGNQQVDNPNAVNVKINNVFARNCGKSTNELSNNPANNDGTDGGIFVFERARFIEIDNVTVINDSDYGKIGGLYRGTGQHIKIRNVFCDIDCFALINSSPARNLMPVVPNNDIVTTNLDIRNVYMNGSCDFVLIHNANSKNKMYRSKFIGIEVGEVRELILNGIVANKVGNYLDVKSSISLERIKGDLYDINMRRNRFSSSVNVEEVRAYKHIFTQQLKVSGYNSIVPIIVEREGTNSATGSIYAYANNVCIGSKDFNHIVKCNTETRNFEIGNGTWDGGHLVMRNRHIWIDSTGKIRLKNGSPTSDTDGIEVSLGS